MALPDGAQVSLAKQSGTATVPDLTEEPLPAEQPKAAPTFPTMAMEIEEEGIAQQAPTKAADHSSLTLREDATKVEEAIMGPMRISHPLAWSYVARNSGARIELGSETAHIAIPKSAPTLAIGSNPDVSLEKS